jgi:hypothetical protein
MTDRPVVFMENSGKCDVCGRDMVPIVGYRGRFSMCSDCFKKFLKRLEEMAPDQMAGFYKIKD